MINVTGEIYIKTTKNNGYYTTTSSKNEEGSEKKYDLAPISVNFRKGVQIDNGTRVNIKNGFLSHYKLKKDDSEEEEIRNKIVVLDYEIIDKKESGNNAEFTPIEDDDLPF